MWLFALPVEDVAVAVSLMLSVAPVASEAIVISENGTLMFVVLGELQQDQPELDSGPTATPRGRPRGPRVLDAGDEADERGVVLADVAARVRSSLSIAD